MDADLHGRRSRSAGGVDEAIDGSRWRSAGRELSIARSEQGAPLLTERELQRAFEPAPAPRALLDGGFLEDAGGSLAGVD